MGIFDNNTRAIIDGWSSATTTLRFAPSPEDAEDAKKPQVHVSELNDSYEMIRALPLCVHYEGAPMGGFGQYIVSNRYANIYGTGFNLEQAIQDARGMLMSRFDGLSEREDKLSELLKRELKYMRAFMKPVSGE